MQGTCTTCKQLKNLHGNSGLCSNCYNKQLLASKSLEEQEELRKKNRQARAKWRTEHSKEVAEYTKKWRDAHPGSPTMRRNFSALAKLQREIPIKTLQDAGIDTVFMRGQLEEHRKQKLMNQIEAGMNLLMGAKNES